MQVIHNKLMSIDRNLEINYLNLCLIFIVIMVRNVEIIIMLNQC